MSAPTPHTRQGAAARSSAGRVRSVADGYCDRLHCGERLAERRDVTIGRIALYCPGCERTARGLCRDCPVVLPWRGTGRRPLRCPTCRVAHRRLVTAAWRERRRNDPEARMKRRRYERRRRRDPEVRERLREQERQWRASVPASIARAYAAAAKRQYRQTERGRAVDAAAGRRWREKNRDRHRAAVAAWKADNRERARAA